MQCFFMKLDCNQLTKKGNLYYIHIHEIYKIKAILVLKLMLVFKIK